MADTYIGATGLTTIATNSTHSVGQAGEILLPQYLKYVAEQSFWEMFVGAQGSFKPFIAKHDLDRDKGDYIKFDLAAPLTAAPVTQTSEIWGSEEAMSFYQDNLLLGLSRKGVKRDKPMSQKRTVHDLTALMIGELKQWGVEYGYDYWVTRKMLGLDYNDYGGTAIGESATAHSLVAYGGDAISTGSIDASDIMDSELLWKLAEIARIGGTLGSTTARKFHPADRGEFGRGYHFVGHPFQISSLKHTAGSDWQEWQKFAAPRSESNKLFAGTGNLAGGVYTPVGMLHGVLVWEFAGLPLYTTWGSAGNVKGCEGLFLGAEAAMLGTGGEPEMVFEGGMYDEYVGIAVKVIMGFDRVIFNSIDNGSILVRTAGKQGYANA